MTPPVCWAIKALVKVLTRVYLMTNEQKKSFWGTIPGILTGIAAVITAAGGLLLALSQVGIIGKPVQDDPTTINNQPTNQVNNDLKEQILEDSEFKPPKITWAPEGWEAYVDSKIIDINSAKGLFPGQASPEAAVTHFYASFIRGDQRYREVLPGYYHQDVQQTPEALRRRLQEYEKWKFERVQLFQRKHVPPNVYWVQVYMEVSFQNESESGTDEIMVQKIDGEWYVVSPPT